jgi:hypothetical protein
MQQQPSTRLHLSLCKSQSDDNDDDKDEYETGNDNEREDHEGPLNRVETMGGVEYEIMCMAVHRTKES